MSPYKRVAAAALILMSGCNAGNTNEASSADPAPGSAPASADPEIRVNEAQPGPAGDPRSASLLEDSTPSEGATLSVSPENLVLNFRTPVRLEEVIVQGSDGQTVPMMITAAGLLSSFSIPMPDLEPGSYTVRWRATDQAGDSHEGSLGFVIT
jgi:methionine-rich copper-binding protein CopC